MKILVFLKLYPILSSLQSSKIRLRSSYSIAKFLSSTKQDYDFFTQRLSNFLLQYGARDDSGNLKHSESNEGFIIDPDKVSDSIKEMEEIQNFEIEVPKLEIYYEDLPDDKITPEELMILMPYIKKNL